MNERETLKERLEALVGEMVERGILFEDACAAFERHFIETVMRRTGRNLSRAADELRIHRNTLRKRMLEIDAERSPASTSVGPALYVSNGAARGSAKRAGSSATARRGGTTPSKVTKKLAKATTKTPTKASTKSKTSKEP